MANGKVTSWPSWLTAAPPKSQRRRRIRGDKRSAVLQPLSQVHLGIGKVKRNSLLKEATVDLLLGRANDGRFLCIRLLFADWLFVRK